MQKTSLCAHCMHAHHCACNLSSPEFTYEIAVEFHKEYSAKQFVLKNTESPKTLFNFCPLLHVCSPPGLSHNRRIYKSALALMFKGDYASHFLHISKKTQKQL